MPTAKEAFKLGFCLKLAEEGVTPEKLLPLVEKQAVALSAITSPLMIGGLAGSTMLPAGAGRAVGRTMSGLSADEMETLPEARRRYMLKRYQDLIARREAEIESRLISQAKREVRE